MEDALGQLAGFIAQGLATPENGARPLLDALFGGRYHRRHVDQTQIRDVLNNEIPFAGLIHPNNPTSGVYSGASVIWFPTKEHGSLLTFVVGTGGLSPDEGLLSRPGHRRRVAAMRRLLSRLGVPIWTKEDPTALGVPVPRVARDRFPGFESTLNRYGSELYAIAHVPTNDAPRARLVVQAFFDLYAYERGWNFLKAYETEGSKLMETLRSDLFRQLEPKQVKDLLLERRFVILQGPPGTGKTRLAEQVLKQFFQGHGATVQFHPAVTYEDFVVGLSPNPAEKSLHFDVRKGWLLDAADKAKEKRFLLIIDEVNRADLGKVLGEAIYLFEPREVGGEEPRTITLAHPVNGEQTFRMPENLYVLATMNTADRSIARLDLAIRRRFAFMNVPPNPTVILEQGLDLAVTAFGQLVDAFVEHAPDDALNLLPGHSYFLADSREELLRRFRFELLPLLDEYLQEGLLGSFAAELQAVRNAIGDVCEHGSEV